MGTQTETVEEALKELWVLFPDGWHCEISIAHYLGQKSQRVYTRFDIHCTDFEQNDFTEYGPTLSEAMAQVRKFTTKAGRRLSTPTATRRGNTELPLREQEGKEK